MDYTLIRRYPDGREESSHYSAGIAFVAVGVEIRDKDDDTVWVIVAGPEDRGGPLPVLVVEQRDARLEPQLQDVIDDVRATEE
jgi:hypothetical protein